jgi:tetratricopeptide (TPR) repeat protein
MEEAATESDTGIGLLESIYIGSGGTPRANGHGIASPGDRSRPDLGASYYGVLMDAYHSRGRIETGRGRPAEALRWLELAATAAPDAYVGFDALRAYGEALLGAGRFSDAMNPLGRARRAWPVEPRLALLYGQALRGLGRPEEALRAIESGLGSREPIPDVLLGDIHYELALVNRDLGDAPRMRYHLRETLVKNPHHPRAASIRKMLAASEAAEGS